MLAAYPLAWLAAMPGVALKGSLHPSQTMPSPLSWKEYRPKGGRQKAKMAPLEFLWLMPLLCTLLHMVSGIVGGGGANPVYLLPPVQCECVHCLCARAPESRVKLVLLCIEVICKPINFMWTPERINIGEDFWSDRPVILFLNAAQIVCLLVFRMWYPFWLNANKISGCYREHCKGFFL